MAFNFPDAPTNGQASNGYVWDAAGTKWVLPSSGGGISQADADTRYVNISGDTMTGALGIHVNTGDVLTLDQPNLADNKWLRFTYSDNAGEYGSIGMGNGCINFYENIPAGVTAWNFQQGNVNVKSTTPSTSPTTGALTVAGGVGISKRLNVHDGAVFTPGGNKSAALTVSGNYGGGIVLQDSSAGGIWQYGHVMALKSEPPAGGGFTNANGHLEIDGNVPQVRVTLTTASTSPTTGALTVAGGVGVAGSIRGGSDVWSTAAIYHFGTSGTQYLHCDAVSFNFVGAAVKVPSTTSSTSPTTGALTVGGGVGIGGNTYTTGGIAVGGSLDVTATSFFHNNVTIHGSVEHKVGAAYATVAGFGYAFGYGGDSAWGMAFRPNTSSAAVHGVLYFYNAAATNVGSITATNTATSYATSSSGELKEDLKSFDAGHIIDATEVYDFKWKSTSERSYGVIAQQAIDVYPLAVTHMTNPQNPDDECWGVDYSKYVPVLLQELKALRARVAQLEGK